MRKTLATLMNLLPKKREGNSIKDRDPARITVKRSTYKLALWTRQLAVLLNAGLPLVKSMEVLSEQCDDPLLGEVLEDVAKRINAGATLSKSLSTYPRVFSRVYVGLVRSGESSGQLGACLERLATMLERETTLQHRLVSALTYPAFVLAVTGVLTLLVFYTILPNFINMFREQHLELPVITKVLIFLTDGVRSPGAWLVMVGLGINLFVAYKRITATERGVLLLYRALLMIPIVGGIMQFANLARFCWVLESVLGTGLTLLRCTKLASAACGSPVIEHDADRLTHCISEGEPLSRHLTENAHIYHSLMGFMIAAAEESGGLQETFARLATWYNQEMEVRLDVLSATFEPVLMAGLAFIVGTIVVGIFLPLYALIGTLG